MLYCPHRSFHSAKLQSVDVNAFVGASIRGVYVAKLEHVGNCFKELGTILTVPVATPHPEGSGLYPDTGNPNNDAGQFVDLPAGVFAPISSTATQM